MSRDGVTTENIGQLSAEKMAEYLAFANRFCAISVTKRGAIASYPTLAEME